MSRIPRKFVFDPTEVGVYHCINRCVRRAFLCGTDILTGKCFDHRKEWIQERLAFLAANLAVDVLGFSILERLNLSGESWLELVHNFRRNFRRAAGTPASLMKEAQK